jgi:hypothetical protein
MADSKRAFNIVMTSGVATPLRESDLSAARAAGEPQAKAVLAEEGVAYEPGQLGKAVKVALKPLVGRKDQPKEWSIELSEPDPKTAEPEKA